MERNEKETETLDALLRTVQATPGAGGAPAAPLGTVDAIDDPAEIGQGRLRPELLKGIHLKVRAELGRARLPLKDALKLGPGAILDLEKLVDDPVDLYVGDLRVARGEVHVINDSFCIRVTEVFAQGGGEEEV
jgi:flagellar motor switch protein FliN/FliY